VSEVRPVRHNPNDPTWECKACGDPWPCATRRAKFLADYVGRRSELRMVISNFFADARVDLADPTMDLRAQYALLHTRFFAWIADGNHQTSSSIPAYGLPRER